METAVAYVRVSSQRQVDEGNSLESQEKQVRAFAHARGYNLTQIFREEGQSAKTDRRPVLIQMLNQCALKKGGIRIVIIPKIDRLARNVMDYANIKMRLQKLGVRLESISERIEDTPSGRFTETIFASVAQFDNEVRSERSRGGMEDAAREGRWVWKAPFGYRNIRVNGQGTIEPDPKNAHIVRYIFEQLAKGHQGLPAIRKRVSEMGANLSRGYLYRMIQNPAYVGKIEAFGAVFDAREPFVPLVDELVAYKARVALRPSNFPQTFQLEHPDFPLRGTTLCSCGSKLTASWSRSSTGAKHGYFRCPKCGGKSFRIRQVEDHFIAYLNGWKHNEIDWPAITAELTRLENASERDANDRSAEVTKRVDDLQKLRSAIAVKNANGIVPDDVAKAELQRLGEEILALRQQLEARETSNTPSKTLVEFAAAFLESLGDSWSLMTLKPKKDLLRFMFPNGVSYDPERGFGTLEFPLLKQATERIQAGLLTVVDPRDEFWNSVTKWLVQLSERFAHEPSPISKSPELAAQPAPPQSESTAAEHFSHPGHQSTSHTLGRRSERRTDAARKLASRNGSRGEPIHLSSRGGEAGSETH